MSFCEIVLVGHVGRDAELSYTQAGRAVCSFSLATNRVWTDRNTNERQEETTWFRVAIWGQQAEALHQYITKGAQVLVTANRVQARPFLGNDGQPRASLEVTANVVRLLGGRGGTGGAPGFTDADYPYSGNAGGNDYGGAQDVDDIPF